MLYFLVLAVKVTYIWIHDGNLSSANPSPEAAHESLHTLRRHVRLRHGRRQRWRTVLVHAPAARGRAAAGGRGGRMLVSGLSGAAYRATVSGGGAHAGRPRRHVARVTAVVRGRVRNQHAVRKKRSISRLAFGPLPSV